MEKDTIEFYKNKNVLITGNTGFKGSWLSKVLLDAGANITGYAINIPTKPSLYEDLELDKKINWVQGDIRNIDKLKEAFDISKPEIVFHLAAQPLVIESYKNPAYTYETNVMGTVNVLECIRNRDYVKSFLNVTTDKVYQNNEWEWGYREQDVLNGYDPYSNSKSCSELVTATYKRCFFQERKVAISTVRAGNVIGGGDYSKNRIIPDCVKAAKSGEKIIIRNPNSVRPYEHVLEAIFAYLLIAKKQYEDIKYADSYNVGPNEEDCVRTENVVKLFVANWKDGVEYECKKIEGPHEANFLRLDHSKIKNKLNWEPKWNIETAIKKTVELSKANTSDLNRMIETQISEYINKEIKRNV